MKLERLEYNGKSYARVSQREGGRLAASMAHLGPTRRGQAAAIMAARREVREFIKRETGRGKA